MSPPMTPREIIANAVSVARGDTHEGKYWAQLSPKSRDDAELGIRRLVAAGYRILGPGEWDPATAEKCGLEGKAAVMKFRAKIGGRYYAGYHEDMRDAVDDAIRALAKEKQGC